MRSYKKCFGKHNENYCSKYLKSINYSIIATNYRNNLAEIDIIAFDKCEKCICFIEVKSRRSNTFSIYSPISQNQLSRIKSCARMLMNSRFKNLNGRIDLITLVSDGQNYDLEHYKNITQ